MQLLIATLVLSAALCACLDIDLSTVEWTAHGYDAQGSPMSMPAVVPGDIYTDALRAGVIGDPYVSTNDVALRWLGARNWTYTCSFDVNSTMVAAHSFVLVQDGVQVRLHHILHAAVQTIADTYLNERLVITSRSMFIGHRVHVDKHMVVGTNTLRIAFAPPQLYALWQAEHYANTYGYSVPPDGFPAVQHGMEHVNMIRTMQASFSWDWGPAYPTMGIYKAIGLLAIESCTVTQLSAQPRLVGMSSMVTPSMLADGVWHMHTDVTLMCARPMARVTVCLRMASIDLVNTFDVHDVVAGVTLVHHDVLLNDADIERWWPHGYGNQSLYTLTASVGVDGYTASGAVSAVIGFRTVRLVQEPIAGFTERDAGLTFYFEVNDVPVFLKGSNWIPADSFLSRVTADRVDFLFASMRAANMNAMRVWGGGVYETDYFYAMADRHGILIWQDMMFAVALYPADDAYLALVTTEVEQQVARLAPHPAILVWAGNNENELGLDGNWFHTLGRMPSMARMKADYMRLYNTTIWAAVNASDHTDRPYLLTSPSSGIQEIRHNGFAPQPASEKYGDVHFYDYGGDAWRESSLLTPRCVTEFGFQSMPAVQTMESALPNNTQWSWFAQPLLHRQHHALGNVEMLAQVLSHFALPFCRVNADTARPECDEHEHLSAHGYFDRLTYLTQLHQGRAYSNQVHHYRAYRNRTMSDGRGQTMCALYWQLNDIWQAPTWSSIDYKQQWKAAQYMARRFFAPLLLDVRLTRVKGDTILSVRLISDLPYAVEGASLNILSYDIGAHSLTPVLNVTTPLLASLPAFSSAVVWSSAVGKLVGNASTDNVDDSFIAVARLLHATLATDDGMLLPNHFDAHSVDDYGIVRIANVTAIDSHTYNIDLQILNDRPAIYVWLEVDGCRGWFADNAFTMTRARSSVRYNLWRGEPPLDVDTLTDKLSVKSLRNVYDKLI